MLCVRIYGYDGAMSAQRFPHLVNDQPLILVGNGACDRGQLADAPAGYLVAVDGGLRHCQATPLLSTRARHPHANATCMRTESPMNHAVCTFAFLNVGNSAIPLSHDADEKVLCGCDSHAYLAAYASNGERCRQ